MAKPIVPAIDPAEILDAIVTARKALPRFDQSLALAKREVEQIERQRADTLQHLKVNVAALKKAVPAAELHDWLGKPGE